MDCIQKSEPTGEACTPVGNRFAGGRSFGAAVVVALFVLIAAGVGYRCAATKFARGIDKPVRLPVPLSAIPMQINGWAGTTVELPTTTDDYMRTNFADDYISRQYMNATAAHSVNLYLVYCSSRMSGILGHQPRVCYPNNGWVWDRTTPSQITTRSGRVVECLVHCFHRPAPDYRQVYVLNFYILNGQATLSEKDFSGWFGRRPNLSGDPARYVAQIQISSLLENSVRLAAADLVDTVMAFLPSKDGRVAAPSSTTP
jgi:EpsI family protein